MISGTRGILTGHEILPHPQTPCHKSEEGEKRPTTLVTERKTKLIVNKLFCALTLLANSSPPYLPNRTLNNSGALKPFDWRI